MESAKSSVEFMSLWCPLRAQQTSLPRLSLPSAGQHTSLFWMEQESSGSLWQHPTHPEKLDTHQSPERSLLAVRCTALKEGTSRVKQLLLSSLFIISDFFSLRRVKLFYWTLRLPQRHRFLCMFVKTAFLLASVLSFRWHYFHQAWIQGLKEFIINNHIQWLILFCP